VDYLEHGRTFPNQRVNAGPDQNYMGFQIILGKVRPFTSPGRGPSTGSDHCSPSDSSHAGFLNIGIALDTLCFDYTPTLSGDAVSIPRTVSAAGQQLIHFAIRLFRQLQAIGTVPAVDMQKYEAAIQHLGAADLASTAAQDGSADEPESPESPAAQ
jgi:hypothetical protein